MPAVRCSLIAPPLDGPPTGGTLYNRELTAALRRAGVSVDVSTLDAPAFPDADLTLVDSLYLDALSDLRERVPAGRVTLLLHYLPTLVRLGHFAAFAELGESERAALTTASGFVVTSRLMEQQLQLGCAASRVVCIEPGTTQVSRTAARPGRLVRAVMLANVVAGKGLLPLLRALSFQLQEHDPLSLEVVGSLDAEPAYVAACRELLAAHPRVQQRVHLLGARPHERALEQLARAQLLVSASHMESYGMALAEARAAGVPIIAMAGGNAFSHVDASAGGSLCVSREEVAAELLRLVRDPAQVAERDALARAAIRSRSWDDAAAELIAAASAGAFDDQRAIGPS